MSDNALPGDVFHEQLTMLAADIDDQSPEVTAAVSALLLEAGALDVVTIPVVMKKNRAAVRIEVLCEAERADPLTGLLLRESTTLGVRRQEVKRIALARREEQVTLSGHDIRIKVALWDGAALKAKPEFEDCLAAARALNRPVREVIAEALAAWNSRPSPTDD